MDKNLLDLYSYYLLSSFGPTTATGLSSLLDGEVSHDQVTRFLSGDAYTSKTLWQHIKSTLRSVERDEGVLIFDDTIQAKPHTDENELICWHFDHTENRSVKGIDLLNCVYQIDDLTIPVAFELVRKPLLFSDPETGQTKRKSEETKNELLRSMLQTCQHNQIKYRYILADSWFSAKDNLTFIRHRLDKHFIVALKSNRTGALSKGINSRDALAGSMRYPGQKKRPYSAGLKDWISRSLQTKTAVRARFIWPVATLTCKPSTSKRSTRNGGESKSSTKRSSPMQP
jgi:hypothetical protein